MFSDSILSFPCFLAVNPHFVGDRVTECQKAFLNFVSTLRNLRPSPRAMGNGGVLMGIFAYHDQNHGEIVFDRKITSEMGEDMDNIHSWMGKSWNIYFEVIQKYPKKQDFHGFPISEDILPGSFRVNHQVVTQNGNLTTGNPPCWMFTMIQTHWPSIHNTIDTMAKVQWMISCINYHI